MGVSIAESFDVRATPERVWSYLIDPRQVVECLPGAELLEAEDERTFMGRMRVKVGPVTASFRGRARFDEIDAAARRVRLSGEGQDTSGAGSARMTMTSEVTALPDGGARVVVQSDVEVVGRLVQFGRGLMEEVSRQMFRQFATCVQQRLEAAEAQAVQAPAGTNASETTSVNAPRPAAAASAAAAAATTSTAAPAPPPLRALPLLWAALRAWLRRLLGRNG